MALESPALVPDTMGADGLESESFWCDQCLFGMVRSKVENLVN